MKEELDNIKKNYLNKFDEIKKNHQKIVKDLSEERDKLNKMIEEIKLKHVNEVNNSNNTFNEKF